MRATIKLIAICLMLFFNINRLCAQIPELMLPIGHTGWIDNAHFSPDGKLVLTASYRDCSVRIWDAVTGDLLKTIKHSDLIRDAIFSSDGKTINGLLKQKSDSCIIWDVKTGDSLSCVSKDESQFNSNNKSSQNVKYVLTDTSTCIYDATTGMLLFDLKEGNYFSKLSPNHKAILTADRAGNVKVRDLSTGSIIGNLEGYLSNIVFSQFTSDGKLVVIATEDSTVYLWNLTTGRQLLKLKSNISNLPFFSTDEKKLFTISLDGYSINIWNLTTGEKIKNLIGHTGEINSCEINKEGTLLLTSSVDKTARIWDIRSGKSVVIFRGYSMGIGGVSDPSLDNKNRYLASACEDSSAIVWSLASGKLVQKFKGHHGPLTAAVISSNGDWLVTASVDSTACIWDIKTGKLLKKFIGHGGSIDKVELSFDCTKLITTSQYDFTFRVWDVNSEHEIFNCYVPSEQQPITVMINDSTFEEWIQTGYSLETFLSFDNKHLIAYSDAKILYVYNLNTKKEVARLNGVKCFPSISRNNKLAIMYEDLIPDVVDTTCGSNSNGQKVFIYDLNKDMRLLQVNSVGGKDDFYNLIFSQDDKYFAIKKNDDSILVFNNSENIINRYYNFGYWELEDGTILTFDSSWIYCDAGPLVEFKLNNFSYSPIFLFSNDNNKLTYADHDKLCIIDADNGNILHTLWHDGLVFPLITSDNSMVFTFGGDHKTKCWDLSSGKLLYTRIQLQGSDWLVYDDNYRFDGSIGAIELLKFRCGSEVTDLAQLKDSLWVPDLANKIMNNQEIIINNKPAPKLSDLNICELTPVIEPLEQENKNILKYRITPRNGGLGETEVYINGNLTYSLKPEQLAKKKENKKVVYYLTLYTDTLQGYLTGEKNSLNPILVKSKVKGSGIYSRGVELSIEKTINKTSPKFFGVFIGVNDYGNATKEQSETRYKNLTYASKDAFDLSNAVETAARNLFKDSCTVYRLTGNGEQSPTKENLQNVFAEIGTKASANDVLYVFFAGHGDIKRAVDENGIDQNQIRFMLEKADKINFKNTSFGIEELTKWCSPQQLKAQKRVFVFDACHSGKIIDQTMAFNGRGDDEGARIRQLDKLKDKNGMMILAAAAANESAYEDETLNQGVLTYHLLEVMKECKDTSLVVRDWFDQTIDLVKEYSKINGNQQEPNSFGDGRFEIGNVNTNVRDAINISCPKTRVGTCVFTANNQTKQLFPNVQKRVNEYFASSNRGDDLVYSQNDDKSYKAQGFYILNNGSVQITYDLYLGKDIIKSGVELPEKKYKNEDELVDVIIASIKSKLELIRNADLRCVMRK